MSKRGKFMSSALGTAGLPKHGEPMVIEKPLVLMFEAPDKRVTTHIHDNGRYGYKGYGLLVCDLVRHIAIAYHVDEDDVWEWVDKERHDHTTEMQRPA